MRPAHPIIAAFTMLAAACGAGKAEVREARRSLYDTEFAIAYASALDVVRDLYPNLEEDPTRGKIATAWHQVAYANRGADDPKSIQAADRALGNDPTGRSALGNPTSLANKRFFIRFDVIVAGGRPWRVRVVGQASEWEPGNAIPSELRGAATPHWLPGRVEALTVAIHKRLKRYAILRPDEAPVSQVEAPPPVDVTAFGPIPTAAAQRIGEVRQAITRRDADALRPQIASDVLWSLGAGPGVDAALAMWQADPAFLEAMASSIDAGCRADDQEVVCPPAATETPGYTGWRLVVSRRPEGWLMTSFVQGD